jgi:hypothetical protein
MRIISALLLTLVTFSSLSHAAEGCRDQIPNRICLTTTDDPSGPCAHTTDPKYIEPFLKSYDLYSPTAKKMFCAIEEIRLLAKLDATAYSNYIFRRGIFDQQLSLARWATWKDQLNFGAPNDDRFAITDKLPFVRTTIDVPAIYFILLHEMAHNIDTPLAGKWQQLSNASTNNYLNKDRICAYWCNPPIPPSEAIATYKSLWTQSDYLSLYASRNADEDFADSFAFFNMVVVSGYDYAVADPANPQAILSAKDKMQSPLFAAKLEILKQVYKDLSTANGRAEFHLHRLTIRP